jgi:hypothetical protein
LNRCSHPKSAACGRIPEMAGEDWFARLLPRRCPPPLRVPCTVLGDLHHPQRPMCVRASAVYLASWSHRLSSGRLLGRRRDKKVRSNLDEWAPGPAFWSDHCYQPQSKEFLLLLLVGSHLHAKSHFFDGEVDAVYRPLTTWCVWQRSSLYSL